MGKLQNLEYDIDAFPTKLEDIKASVEEKAEEAEGFLDKIADFFKAIVDFFKNLFGISDSEETEPVSEPSIFDDVDTSVFE